VTPWKLELAKTFGATDTVDSSGTDPVEAVQALTGGYGADVSIEAVNQHHGGPVATDHAFRMTRNGGQVVLVGGAGVAIPNGFIAQGKIVRGVLYGNADLERDFDKLGRLYLDGQLLLDELATRRLPIEGINDAFDAMRAGEVARSLLVYR
jgi:Zn-dependent alcohol dehydrogenase